MRRASLAPVALLCLSIFLGLAVPLCFWPMRAAPLTLVGLSIYSLVCVGMSVELCELLLALIWRPMPQPALTDIPPGRRRRVAVLMTVCDDATRDHLLRLRPLADAGYHVFLLDDSVTPVEVPAPLARSISIVRREGRAGAKAGNVNNWLRLHGTPYELCILLDSDSVMPAAAADALVRAADHPANAVVAVLQAAVLPFTVGRPTWLQRVLAAGVAVRRRIHARVHARLDILLSFGHNQLLRLSALRAVGGLDERWSAEDTALSLRLVASGYGVAMVDVCTHDTDPRTLDRYLRRTVRWARQTVELFSGDWRAVPLRYKAVLCWHLLSYVMPLLATALLLLSLWRSPLSPSAVVDFSVAALRFEHGYEAYGIAMWPGIVAVLVRTGLGTAIALIEGGGLGGRLRAALFGGAIQAFVLLPVAVGMLASALGKATSFEPTNSKVAPGSRRLLALGSMGAVGLFAMTVFGLLFHPGGALIGMNGVWCVGLMGVPVLLVVAAFDR